MLFCDNKYLVIKSDIEPQVKARTILPFMSKDEIKDIKKKPFICTENVNFFIIDKRYGDEYRVLIPKGYTTDIASIPKGFQWLFGGKANPYFVVCATIHDILTEKPYMIDYDRYLSSLIFRELLISCGYNKAKAQIMFLAVDNFQKLQPKWKR